MQKKQRAADRDRRSRHSHRGVFGTSRAGAGRVELAFLVDSTEVTIARTKALADAYTAMHPEVTFAFETRPQGAEGDNITKTRLATGEMIDVFWYNSGSLLKALNPSGRWSISPASPASPTCRSRTSPPSPMARHLRRPRGDGHGWRPALQQADLCGPRAFGAHDVGGVRRQQRSHQGRRYRAGRSPPSVRTAPGPRSSSSWPTTTTSRRPSPTRRAVHQQPDQVRHDARRAGRFRAPPGGLREGLVSGGLRCGHVRRRSEHARCRRDRPLPDALLRAALDRRRSTPRWPRTSASWHNRAPIPRTPAPPSGCRARCTSPRHPGTSTWPRTSSVSRPRSRALRH